MSERREFTSQQMNEAAFTDCAMKAARFTDIDLSHSAFEDINLRGARLNNVNLSGVSITDANIDGLTILGHDIAALIRQEMAAPQEGTELARPFVPARDFELSKSFYEALGFRKLLDSDVAIFGIGASSFILQNYFDTALDGHFMMQMMVHDLDAWWTRIEALNLPATFGVEQPRPPALQPWGLRVAYVVDPSGVLWHVAQRRPENPSDR